MDTSEVDALLQAHLDKTRQCQIFTADTYAFEWDVITTDGKHLAFQERVRQQGRQGQTFTRIHQRNAPTWGFSAYGRTAEGKVWSAANGSVTYEITDPAIASSLIQNLDPTPLCAYQARFRDRNLIGEEEFEGQLAHKLLLRWQDGTETTAWIAKDTGLLAGTLTEKPGLQIQTGMKTYTSRGDVMWPAEERVRRTEGDTTFTSIHKLDVLELNPERFNDVGPQAIEALLAKYQADAEAPGVKGTAE